MQASDCAFVQVISTYLSLGCERLKCCIAGGVAVSQIWLPDARCFSLNGIYILLGPLLEDEEMKLIEAN